MPPVRTLPLLLLLTFAACAPSGEFQFNPALGANSGDASGEFAGNGAWDGAGYAAAPGGGGFAYDDALGPDGEQ